MSELPFIFPAQGVESLRRFIISDVDSRIYEAPTNVSAASSSTAASVAASLDNDNNSSLAGSASVSTLRIGQEDVVIMTSLLSNGCLSVVRSGSWSSPASTSPSAPTSTTNVMIELDLHTEAKIFHRPAKIQCFVSSSGHYRGAVTCIHMMVIDVKGNIMTVELDAKSLQPSERVRCCFVAQLMVEKFDWEDTGVEVHSTRIAILSEHVVLMSLSPRLVAVHIVNQDVVVWSEARCVQQMNRRKSRGLAQVLSKFIGQTEDEESASTKRGGRGGGTVSALCATSYDPNDAGVHNMYVFTLHEDATIRRWWINPQTSLQPSQVDKLPSHHILPSPTLWVDAHNSVALCARLYESVYVVAVHVQTEQESLFLDGEEGENGAPRMWVIYGPLEHEDNDPTITSHVSLKTPENVTTLVGFDFVAAQQRCSLSVMYQATSTMDPTMTGTLWLTYPPGVMTIVSKEPILLSQYSLDDVAQVEQQRIKALSLATTIDDSDDVASSSLEDDIQQLDSLYLKELFRPARPKGVGILLPPPAHCIRSAISKLVSGRGHGMDTGDNISIELETSQAMHAWRVKENRSHLPVVRNQPIPATTTAFMTPQISKEHGPTQSIYERYVAAAEESDQAMMTDDDEEEVFVDAERIAQVEAHEKRWRGFLLQVWEEEQSLRKPLAFQLLVHQPEHNYFSSIVVRAGVTSYLSVLGGVPAQKEEVNDAFDVLDQTAAELYRRIQCNPHFAPTLDMVEQRIWNISAKGSLASCESPHKVLSKVTVDLAHLGHWARRESDAETQIPSDSELESIICDGAKGDFFSWLRTPPLNLHRPGLQLLKGFNSGALAFQDTTTAAATNFASDLQTRHAAGSLTVMCMESLQKIQLCRCLLFFGIGDRFRKAKTIAFQTYMHATSVLWVATQQVPAPTVMVPRQNSLDRLLDASSPRKKLSNGREFLPWVPDKKTTAALDVLIIHLSHTNSHSESRVAVPIRSVIGLAQAALASTFRVLDGRMREDPWGTAYRPSLPELGVLPPSSHEQGITDFPHLALRLIAPVVAFENSTETADEILFRKEALAICLLIESKGSSNADKLQEKASTLLLPAAYDLANASGQEQLSRALEAISSLKTQQVATANTIEALARKLHGIVFPRSSVAVTAILRLCSRPTAFAFLACLLNLNRDDEAAILPAIAVVAKSLMHLSNLIYRLDILDRHIGSSGRASVQRGHCRATTFITFIENTIHEADAIFPQWVLQEMPEYSNLCMLLYLEAVCRGEWPVAFSACINDPSTDHRIRNFKGLVRAMVGDGALEQLLDKRSIVSRNVLRNSEAGATNVAFFAESVDFYEVAAETLATASAGQTVAQSTAGALPPDYHGALYALHVTKDQWRRAAQAMDIRFIFATQMLADCAAKTVADLGAIALQEGRIVEDLILGSVAAANSLALVGDIAHQFLVSGEVGPFPYLPTKAADLAAGSKRTRDSNEKRSYGYRSQSPTPKDDRLARFMTPGDLVGRAVRTIGLRTLFFDGSSNSAFVRKALLSESISVETDQEIIAQLAALGYFDHAMSLARACGVTSQHFNIQTKEQRLFHDAISFILRGYLVPFAVDGPLADESTDEGNSRPTLPQLHRSLDSITTKASSVLLTSIRKRSELLDTARCMAAMELVRHITKAYTTAESPLAVQVADMFLQYDKSCVVLPSWLERLLNGDDSFDGVAIDGLFARRPIAGNSKYLGDPSALLTIYMKWGMYTAACNVVSSVLSGKSAEDAGLASRQAKAASRLPEAGELDFIPYRKIDILWEMIEIVLNDKNVGKDEMRDLQVARKRMEESLEKHFEMMKISEMGASSARALSRAP